MPEKIKWEPKKKKEKATITPELQNLIPMKIERIEIKPTKLTFVPPTEEVQFATIKLKKTSIPKRRESKSSKVPKIRLKSRILFISDWPTPLQMPSMTIIEENPLQNGTLSRNMDEAEKVLRKKYRKKKLPEKEITDLEKLDKEFEELKKKPLETIDDKSIYEKPQKVPKQKSPDEIKTLKIGKGKIPEHEDAPEDIKLKKIPKKETEENVEIQTKPKSEEKPVKSEECKEIKPEFTMQQDDFIPSEYEKPELEKFIPDQEQKSEDELPDKVPDKYKRPERKGKAQDFEHVPIIKGKPKPVEPEDAADVKFRIPEKDKPAEEPEKITLKPWIKDEPDKVDNKEIDGDLNLKQLPHKVNEMDEDDKKPLKKKKKSLI